jgi:integrase/recombinase XerD
MCSTEYDSVAQLGERHLDRVEVAGSSPVGIIG